MNKDDIKNKLNESFYRKHILSLDFVSFVKYYSNVKYKPNSIEIFKEDFEEYLEDIEYALETNTVNTLGLSIKIDDSFYDVVGLLVTKKFLYFHLSEYQSTDLTSGVYNIQIYQKGISGIK